MLSRRLRDSLEEYEWLDVDMRLGGFSPRWHYLGICLYSLRLVFLHLVSSFPTRTKMWSRNHFDTLVVYRVCSLVWQQMLTRASPQHPHTSGQWNTQDWLPTATHEIYGNMSNTANVIFWKASLVFFLQNFFTFSLDNDCNKLF